MLACSQLLSWYCFWLTRLLRLDHCRHCPYPAPMCQFFLFLISDVWCLFSNFKESEVMFFHQCLDWVTDYEGKYFQSQALFDLKKILHLQISWFWSCHRVYSVIPALICCQMQCKYSCFPFVFLQCPLLLYWCILFPQYYSFQDNFWTSCAMRLLGFKFFLSYFFHKSYMFMLKLEFSR